MPDHDEAIGRPGRRNDRYNGSRRGLAIGATVFLGAAVVGLALGSGSTLPMPVASSGTLSGPLLTTLSAAGVQTVSIDAIAGKVAVTASGGTVVSDAGSSGPLFYQFDAGTHTLQLFCPGPRNCAAADYTVAIPEHVGLVLHQVSGQTTLTGLSGSASYTVVQHVTSGDVNISVPQGPNAAGTVDATVVSGEISLADG